MNADWMLSMMGVFVEPRQSTRGRHIRSIAWSQPHRVDTNATPTLQRQELSKRMMQ